MPSTVVKKETLHSYRAIGPGVSLARTLEATLTPVRAQRVDQAEWSRASMGLLV